MSEISPDNSGHLECGPHRVWWEYFGKGDREAVVLLNGLAMHTKAWYGFLVEFRPEFDVLLYDYLGQGDSSSTDEPYLIPDFCHHLAAILNHLEIDRVHTMGVSYSGFIALDFGRLYQIYTHYLYEKIFGEEFLRQIPGESLENMRELLSGLTHRGSGPVLRRL